MSTPPTIQTNPLEPVFSGVPVVIPQEGLVNPTWNKWFVDLREKVNVINSILASWSGITPVTGVTPGTYGDTTHYPIVSVSANGLVTDITNQAIHSGGGDPIHVTVTTTNHTVALADIPADSSYRGLIVAEDASANYVYIDTFANTGIPVGATMQVFQKAIGTVTIAALPGVSILGPTISGGGQNSLGEVTQINTDLWIISGDIGYSAQSDPYWAYVTSLLHFNESAGATSFTDQKGNVWSVASVQGSSGQAKFGSTSAYFSSTTDSSLLLSTTTKRLIGVGAPFTVEAWVYPSTNPPNSGGILYSESNWGAGGEQLCGAGTPAAASPPNASYYLRNTSFSPSKNILGTANSIPLLAWTFISYDFDGSTTRLFANGVLVGSSTDTGWRAANSNAQYCGHVVVGGYEAYRSSLQGYMAEFRITSGVCRHTAAYTPPTAPFPNY